MHCSIFSGKNTEKTAIFPDIILHKPEKQRMQPGCAKKFINNRAIIQTMPKPMKLVPMGKLPSKSWEDLVDEERRTKVTVWTLGYVRESKDLPAIPGIHKGKDGIYDIIIDAPQLVRTNITDALKELTQLTGIDYKL